MNASATNRPDASETAALPAKGADPMMPRAIGLYDPANEHDSCGVGFVADMKNRKSHGILEKGLQILVNLDHRGAVGADPTLGDGCGVLTQIPHEFFVAECGKLGMTLPEPGEYAIGQFFMPQGAVARAEVERIVEEVVGDRRAEADRLARRAGRQLGARRPRQGGRAGASPGVHRPRRQCRGPGGVRAQAVHRPQGGLDPGL